jgi:hypothetical protein
VGWIEVLKVLQALVEVDVTVAAEAMLVQTPPGDVWISTRRKGFAKQNEYSEYAKYFNETESNVSTQLPELTGRV